MDPDRSKPFYKVFLAVPPLEWVPATDPKAWMTFREECTAPPEELQLDFVAFKDGPDGYRYAVWQESFVSTATNRRLYFGQRWEG